MAKVSLVNPRLDAKPWGGTSLAQFGLPLPPETPIGEAVVTANDAEIRDGFGQGTTLGEVVGQDPAQWNGGLGAKAVGQRSFFPLLAKLIDAREDLSIQVHPDDKAAVTFDEVGKTEAWHVLAADPGAVLYLGLRPGVTLDQFAAQASKLDGSSAELLRAVPAVAGMTVLLPAGTIHALGAGVMVYEIQQPSAVTYRLDDWGRVGIDGKPREMHLELGLKVSRPELLPEAIRLVELRSAVGKRHLLVACRYFSLERWALPAGGSVDLDALGSPQVLTLLEGKAEIDGISFGSGESVVIWPETGPVAFNPTEPVIALRAQVPDLDRDVVRPALASGAERRDIVQLAGPLPDLLGLPF